MDRAGVGDLARAVDPDEAARLPVAARVEREHGEVALRQAVRGEDRVHDLAVLGEPVQEDDRRPASRRSGAVREVKRRRDRHAVVHRDRQVLPRLRRPGGLADEEDEAGRDGR